ncbi:MAG: energy transducer TonB [Candidatus Acidiferrales bacterium]
MLFTVSAGLLLSWTSAARAQEAQIDQLAHESADALVKAQMRHVVVLDFTGTDAMSALGEKLAADFRAALTGQRAAWLKVEDRAATLDRATEMSLTLANLRDPATLRWVYHESDVDSRISGKIAEQNDGLMLTLDVERLVDDTQIAKFTTAIPLLPDLKALIAAPPADDEFASLPVNGAVGYTKAVCIACPFAVYSTEALHARAQGTVILAFTIDKHGRTKDVRVKQAMPDGLTQQAIDAVLGWKFTPAKDSRGKRVQVRQQTEVDFRLN